MSDAGRRGLGSADCFEHTSAADRYARSRPYFHPIVVSKIRNSIGQREPIPRALDVGCGTGLSTVALREIADLVIGADSAPAMLAHAPQVAGLHFVVATAERLPFTDGAFDLMTVASAFHWLERSRFLSEAFRLLQPSAWLVVYDNAFFGAMDENPRFRQWMRETYGTRYPAPPRDRRPLTEAEADSFGFHLAHSEEYSNSVSFSPGELVAYLTTQSNVIAAVEAGEERLDAVDAWLLSAVTPQFIGNRGTFRFGGVITYLPRA